MPELRILAIACWCLWLFLIPLVIFLSLITFLLEVCIHQVWRDLHVCWLMSLELPLAVVFRAAFGCCLQSCLCSAVDKCYVRNHGCMYDETEEECSHTTTFHSPCSQRQMASFMWKLKLDCRLKSDTSSPDFLETPRTSYYRNPHDFQQIPENSDISLELTKNFMLYLYDQRILLIQKFKDKGECFPLVDL